MQQSNITRQEISLNVLVGMRIRQIRLQKDMSQEEFAWLIGVHRTYLGQLERAEKNVSIKNIEKICKALKIEPKDFFDFTSLE